MADAVSVRSRPRSSRRSFQVKTSAERDQLRPQQRVGGLGEEGAEGPLDPRVMGRSATVRHRAKLGNPVLLRQQPQALPSPSS